MKVAGNECYNGWLSGYKVKKQNRFSIVRPLQHRFTIRMRYSFIRY